MKKAKLVDIYNTSIEKVNQILVALNIDSKVEDLTRDQVLDFDYVFEAMAVRQLKVQAAVEELLQSKGTSAAVLGQMSETELAKLRDEIEAASAQRNRLIIADEMMNVEDELREFTAAAYQSALVRDLTSGNSLLSLLPTLRTVAVEVQEVEAPHPKPLPSGSSSKNS